MFFIAFGLAISYWTNYFVKKIVNDDSNNLLWRIPLTIQLIPALLLCMGMFCLFETPRWLCTHEKEDEARMVLAKVRRLDIADANITEEIKEIISSQCSGSGSSWRDVLAESNRRRLFLGCALQFFQQMTGTNLINYFSPIIFRSIGLDSGESELLATGVYGIVKMCVVLVGFSSLIDRTGRRPLLVFGGLMLSVCLFAQAVIVSSPPPTTVSAVLVSSRNSFILF
jgi:MFS family permease